jgi:hypothetical protein
LLTGDADVALDLQLATSANSIDTGACSIMASLLKRLFLPKKRPSWKHASAPPVCGNNKRCVKLISVEEAGAAR